MSQADVLSVRYREQQVLAAADLRGEQDYRTSMRRRHQIGGHRWGVITGLELEVDPDTGSVYLRAGAAADGYGRELFVPADVRLPLEAPPNGQSLFDRLGSDKLSVWLLYGREPAGAFSGGENTRWREVALLRLLPITAAEDLNFPGSLTPENDPRRPASVPAADLDHGPQDPPHPDPADEWPVFLGQVERLKQDNTLAAWMPYRVQAGLVGEQIRAPSGETSLGLGEAGDLSRFSVSTQAGGSAEASSRISIDSQGRSALNGHAYLRDQHLHIADGQVPETTGEDKGKKRAWGASFQPRDEPAAAAPWQIYRSPVTDPVTKAKTDDLRVEFFNPGAKGDPRRYRVVIGTRSVNGEHGPNDDFHPCVTIDSDCQVTFAKPPTVLGQVIESPVAADPNDPRFGGNIFGNWEDAVTKAGDTLQDFYNLLDVQIGLPAVVKAGDALNYNVTITNNATVAVTLIQVSQNRTLDSDTLDVSALLGQRTTLLPKGTTTINALKLNIPGDAQNKKLAVGIVAVGIRQSGGVAAGMGSETRTIQPPPPPPPNQ